MKSKKPLVSVIIPTRDRFKLLKRSLESVLNQTYEKIEVIVIDDASRDETNKFLRSVEDERLKFIRLTKRRGAAGARNIGLRKSKGGLIAFNDDDDLWLQEKLEKQVRALTKADEKVGVVYSRIKRLYGKKKRYFPGDEIKKKEGNLRKPLLLDNFIALPVALVKRECLIKVGLFDERLACLEDWELWLRISRFFDFKYLPETLVKSPVLSRGITSSRAAGFEATRLIFQKHLPRIKKDKKILAAWQFRLGVLYYQQRKMKRARRLFLKALKNHLAFKYFRGVVKTILGKRLSEAIISVKMKLLGNIYGKER